jgi:surfactin synthase thioesterase subunit
MISLRGRKAPAASIYLFHHAGGMPTAFFRWERHFPVDWEIHLMEHPGRGSLCNLTPAASPDHILDHFQREIGSASTGEPFIFFGHSMGAWLAWRLVVWLEERGAPLPAFLGVSGKSPPATWATPPSPFFSAPSAPDEELWGQLCTVGGVGDPQLIPDDLKKLSLTWLRDDLALYASAQALEAKPPVSVPLGIWCGLEDPIASSGAMPGWGEATTRATRLFPHPGGHFYLHERAAEIVSEIVDLAGQARPAPSLPTRRSGLRSPSLLQTRSG